MLKIPLIILLLSCALSLSVKGDFELEPIPVKQCTGRNEVYSTCGGCEPTCARFQLCRPLCVSGCFCKVGFVRKDGECVRKHLCNPNTKSRASEDDVRFMLV